MLPSTGLFRKISCPFFEEGECVRPFCHFLHAPKKCKNFMIICNNFALLQAFLFVAEAIKPTYHATPIEPKPEEVKVKKKLEYLPIPGSKNPKNNVATYTPSIINKNRETYNPVVSNNSSAISYIPTKIDEIKNDETNPAIIEKMDVDKDPVIKESNNEEIVEANQLSSKHHSSSSHKKSSKDHHKSSHKSSHKDSKSSSSSHRHKSSHKSSSRDKSSSDRDKSSSDKDKTSHRSKSSSKHEKSSSSSSRHKSSSSSRHKSSSSSSSRHKSSHSDHKDKEKDKEVKNNIKRKAEVLEPEIESFVDDVDVPMSDDDADDIEDQCRMIFESYEAPSTSSNEIIQPKKPSQQDQNEEPHFEIKKRQAHENAVNVNRPTLVTRHNHVQSALLTAQKRQDVALQKLIMEKKAKEEEIAKLENEIKQKEEAMVPAVNMTPLINPLIHVRPPPLRRPQISPISHRMAIEAAKRKVMEINKGMQQQSSTPAQTASKSARVAHKPTNVNDLDITKLAPPILEAHNTKISCNVRTQMYKMMVKHCIEIYSLPADAFERAQNEEHQVFKKCSIITTYKTSAMLTINRLKKEAEAASSKKIPKVVSHDVMLGGALGSRVSWSMNHKIKVGESDSSLLTIDTCSSSQAYDLISECLLSEDQLRENGFPRSATQRGQAQFYVPKKARPQNGKEGKLTKF